MKLKAPKHIPPERIIPEDEYNNLIFQFRTQVNGLLQVFNGYGLEIYINPITTQIVELAENLGQAVRGDKHKPIHIISKPLSSPFD